MDRKPASKQQKPKICPVCDASLQYNYVSLSELLLMCENTKCDYPFGYVKRRNLLTKESKLKETASSTSLGPHNNQSTASLSASLFVKSVVGKSNRDHDSKLNTEDPLGVKVFRAEDSMANSHLSIERKRINKLIKKLENKSQKNLASLNKLNEKLNQLKDMDGSIENDDWLKILMSLPSSSGIHLSMQNEESDFGMGELKI